MARSTLFALECLEIDLSIDGCLMLFATCYLLIIEICFFVQIFKYTDLCQNCLLFYVFRYFTYNS